MPRTWTDDDRDFDETARDSCAIFFAEQRRAYERHMARMARGRAKLRAARELRPMDAPPARAEEGQGE